MTDSWGQTLVDFRRNDRIFGCSVINVLVDSKIFGVLESKTNGEITSIRGLRYGLTY